MKGEKMAKTNKPEFPAVIYTRFDGEILSNFDEAKSAVLDSSGIGPVIVDVYKLVEINEMSVMVVVNRTEIIDKEFARTLGSGT
jgi:hypothetical protein